MSRVSRAVLVAWGAALLAPTVAAAPSRPGLIAVARPELAGGGVYVLSPGGSAAVRRVVSNGLSPAWSPNGRRLAYVVVSAGSADIHVADADGTPAQPLMRTPDRDEEAPAWSPDGRRLAFVADGAIHVAAADGRGERRLAEGRDPAWSPDGRSIAFVSDRLGNDDLYVVRAGGGGLLRLTSTETPDSEPAWAPDSRRLAFVGEVDGGLDIHVLDLRTGAATRLTDHPFNDRSPAWSPDGRRIAFATDRSGTDGVWTMSPDGSGEVPLPPRPGEAGEPAWQPLPVPRELLPDLDERPPADLSIETVKRGGRKRFLLGFASATDNVGEGPVTIVASRPDRRTPTMRASQRVRLANGSARTYPRIGILRYVTSASHSHWHLMGFQRFELRRTEDNALVVRDRKSGFCLADHYGEAPGRLLFRVSRPVFEDDCLRGEPDALAVDQGTSVGYTDRYPSHFHGQNLDVTGVPAGDYVLVHRANSDLRITELRYTNNAASLAIRLSWPRGRTRRPSVRVLAVCPASDRCTAG